MHILLLVLLIKTIFNPLPQEVLKSHDFKTEQHINNNILENKLTTLVNSLIKITFIFSRNKNLLFLSLKLYHGDINTLYEITFRNKNKEALKLLLRNKKYNYDKKSYGYNIKLFNNKHFWVNDLLNKEYIYDTSIFSYSSLSILVMNCNDDLFQLAIKNGFDLKANSNLLDLSLIKKCKKINKILLRFNLKADLLLHILRNDYYSVKFIINHKIYKDNLNKVTKIETLDYNFKITKVFNNTIMDYAVRMNNPEIISLLRQHGVKRSCEILKTKCEPLSPKIEKILNGDK